MTTVLYCENAPYAQNHSIGFEQTQEIDLTNNILFTPIDLLYLQFLADVSLGDCEKSTHCTQPSSTTVTAIEDLRSAIAKVKATAASKEDLAKLASKLDRLNQNFSEQPVSNKEDLPKVESNIVRVVERLISQLDVKISSLDSAISRVDSKIDRVENKLVETINAMKAELKGDIARTQNSLERNISGARDYLEKDIASAQKGLECDIDRTKDSLKSSIFLVIDSLNRKIDITGDSLVSFMAVSYTHLTLPTTSRV